MATIIKFPTLPFEPLESERRNFAPQPELSLLEWAEQHCYVTEGPLVPEGGRAPIHWSPAAFPLQRTVLEAVEDPQWSRIVLMASPQCFGKTEALAKPVLLHALRYRGVSAAYVGPRIELAVSQWKRKLAAAMLADDGLAELFFDNPDQAGDRTRRDFTNGTSLHCAGAESEAALSGFTAPVIVCDDVQAMPATLPGRGHPVDIAFARAEAAPRESCSFIQIGTAGTVQDYHWRTLEQSTLYAPFVPCPGCGTYQLLEWERLVFDAEDVAAAQRDTWLRCANELCTHRISFDDLDQMLAEHLWVSLPPDCNWWLEPPEGGSKVDPDEADVYPHTSRNTNIAGFVANALYWPHGASWGQRVAEWIRSKGNPEKLKTWQQQVLNRPWSEPEIDEEKLTVGELESHSSVGHVAGTVPAAADLLTVTVDVQSGYVYYLVRAWRKSDGESWLVALGTMGRPLTLADESPAEHRARRAAGIAGGLDEVDALCAKGWPQVDAQGEEKGRISPVLGLIDRGYEKDVVAGWWVVKHRGIWRMIKGQKAGGRAELWPPRPRTDQRGRPWRLVDVNQAKHVLRRLLRIAAGQPGYWHFPERGLHVNTTRAYFRHLASERWRTDVAVPRWEPVQKGVANHFLDCETYQISAARACGVQLGGFQVPQVAAPHKPPRPAARDRRPPLRRSY